MAEASPFLPIYVVLGAVILIAAAMLWYVWSLRNRLDTAIARLPPDCAAYSALLTGYNDLPLGVPRGTVRAVLAVILVFGSVVFLAVSMLGTESGVVYKFPEALTGILGAILGFYFGKGSSGEDGQAVSAVAAASADARAAIGTAADARAQADAARRQAADAQQSLGAVQAQHDALAGHQLDHIRTGLQAGADIGRVVASSLPGSFGTEVGAAADALAQTAATVADLSTGDLGGAVQKATQLAQQAASNMPVVQVLAKAAPMIASALGGAIPPVALIAALVSAGSLLSAAAYGRWIARVMDAPYTPEQFSPTVFDSNAARSLIAQGAGADAGIRPEDRRRHGARPEDRAARAVRGRRHGAARRVQGRLRGPRPADDRPSRARPAESRARYRAGPRPAGRCGQRGRRRARHAARP